MKMKKDERNMTQDSAMEPFLLSRRAPESATATR